MVFRVAGSHKFLNHWFSKAVLEKRLSQLLFQKKRKFKTLKMIILINKIHKRSTIFNIFHIEISDIHHSQSSISFFFTFSLKFFQFLLKVLFPLYKLYQARCLLTTYSRIIQLVSTNKNKLL